MGGAASAERQGSPGGAVASVVGPRVALITSQAFSLVNFRESLIREMVARGCTVFALAPDFDAALREGVARLGATPVDISMSRATVSPLRDSGDVARLASTLRGLKLDVTLSYFIKPVIYGLFAARAAGVPHRFALIEGAGHVFDDHSDLTVSRRALRFAVTRLYRSSLRSAEKVFVLNRDDESLFIESGMAASDRVVRLGAIGVELERFQPGTPVNEPVTFIMAARLIRQKGVAEFVEAARVVRAQHPSARFILLGETDLNPGSLRRDEIAAWVDAGLIEWPGQVPDVRPWLRQASVFVLPSYYREGIPRSTQEAMAMGLPVITTDWVGCRETVEEGRNGLLVPVRDANALAEAMLRFVKQPALVGTMGAESRAMAVAMFDAKAANARLLAEMGITA